MKSVESSTFSGCVVWIIVVGILSACLLPVSFAIGTSTTESDLAVKTTAPYVCPKGTSTRVHSYQGTTQDESGNDVPATLFELQCLDAAGKVVYTDPVMWSFIWLGITVGSGVLAIIILALLFAAPARVLIGRFLGGTKTSKA